MIRFMHHVCLVVDDLAAATAFFAELGMELEGDASLEGELVDRIVGLDGVRTDLTMLRTPDGNQPHRARAVPRTSRTRADRGRRHERPWSATPVLQRR